METCNYNYDTETRQRLEDSQQLSANLNNQHLGKIFELYWYQN